MAYSRWFLFSSDSFSLSTASIHHHHHISEWGTRWEMKKNRAKSGKLAWTEEMCCGDHTQVNSFQSSQHPEKKHTTRLNAPNTKERAQEGEVEGEVKSLRRPLQPAPATCDYFMREKSLLGHLMVKACIAVVVHSVKLTKICAPESERTTKNWSQQTWSTSNG